MPEIIVSCPHCAEYICISKINCGIFRHCIYIKNGKQVPPHTKKDKLDKLIANGEIYGCGKPFQINKNTHEVSICDYI